MLFVEYWIVVCVLTSFGYFTKIKPSQVVDRYNSNGL